MWLYVGSVQTLEYNLFRELTLCLPHDSTAPFDSRIRQRASDLLKVFSTDKHWLAALAGEGPVFGSMDPEGEQLIIALGRFTTGTTKLLTRDESLCERYPDLTITPEQYLQTPSRPNRIAFIDLKTQQGLTRSGLETGIHRVLHHGQYIMGPEIKELESKLAEFVGVKHCITCASGTDALLMVLMALGIGPGDEVITVPYTWISTAEVIALLRGRPVFVDIQSDTFNLDPEKLEAAITPKTKAIMPVGIYGQCADMSRIKVIAEKHAIPVVEDAAQCFGATHHGEKSCNLSLTGCTSFFPSKPLGCYGDGGAIFTSNGDLAEKLHQIRIHGQKVKHQHPLIGINGRLDTLQAAVLLEKFALFEEECALRVKVAKRYDAMLSNIAGVRPPIIADGNTSVYAQYTILAEGRDALSQKLMARGIPSVAYYTVPLHLQDAFADLGHTLGHFPNAEQVAARCLSLPMSPYLTEAEQQKVANALK